MSYDSSKGSAAEDGRSDSEQTYLFFFVAKPQSQHCRDRIELKRNPNGSLRNVCRLRMTGCLWQDSVWLEAFAGVAIMIQVAATDHTARS